MLDTNEGHSTLSCTVTPLCLLPSIWISDAQNLLTHSWIVDQWWISELWLRSDGNSLFEWKKSEILFQNASRVWFTPCTGSILTFNHAATSSLSSSSLKFFDLFWFGLMLPVLPTQGACCTAGGFYKRKAQHCSPQFHSSSLCNTHLLPFLVWTATNDSCSNDKRENNIMTDYK